MSFSYSAGSSTPGYGGLAEFTSLRICQGIYRPLDIPPLRQSAPLRYVVTPIPRGGGKMGTVSFDAWQFDLQGYFDVSSPDDVQAATDYLLSKVNAAKGAMGLTLNALGWAATRTMTVRLAGQVEITEPELDRKKLTRRLFSLPLLAEDPIQYASSLTTTPITTGTTVTNAGTAAVPHLVHFDGANTSWIQVADAVSGAKVRLDYAIPSSKFVEVNTRDGSILTDTGVDLYQYLQIDDDARYLPAGTSSWTKTSGGGGSASIKHYSGWA